ncbi:hypothetical protein GCM10011579_025470 [Streptomyces albiflavescens]|uniref:OmpR/PhoB-type domain-containing protein n=1 Tax=Streptomyces albiflavescens TaxID=1623582 RepID=A0A917XYY4_9ACTN|nr:hypothetical protein GCM10011579_025470 [Streptomyces albiflavescens]
MPPRGVHTPPRQPISHPRRLLNAPPLHRHRTGTRADRPLDLTRTEYALLEYLLRHPARVLSRAQILKEVWGFDFEPTSNTLDVYVMYLRRKLESHGGPRLIHTVRGLGYMLRAQ